MLAATSRIGAILVDMVEISNIHAFEDEDFLRVVVRSSAVVAVLSIVAGVLLFGFAGLSCEISDGSSPVAWLLCVAAASVAVFALHEGVHAFFFKLFAPAGARVSFGANWECAMIYACAAGIVYSRRQYLMVLLAPTVLVTTFCLAMGLAGAYPLACFVIAAIHVSGCTGDWVYCARILRDRRILACEDTDWGVRFLGEPDVCEGESR